MGVTISQSHAGVSFAMSQARPEGQSSDVARALGRVQRLAEARSAAWLTRRPTRRLTRDLDVAWADLRLARATDHRVERVVAAGHEHAVSRFLRDCCVSDPGARTALSTFAAELREYVTDDQERDDLPTSRQLARQLRARGIEVAQAGPRVWVLGLRLVNRDETRQTPQASPDSQLDGYGSSREHQANAATSRRKVGHT